MNMYIRIETERSMHPLHLTGQRYSLSIVKCLISDFLHKLFPSQLAKRLMTSRARNKVVCFLTMIYVFPR